MKIKSIFFLIFSITLYSCNFNKDLLLKDGVYFKADDDNIEKVRFRSTLSSELKPNDKGSYSLEKFYLDFETFVSEEPYYQNYYLKITYLGQDWLFIKSEKLLIVCDNNKREFNLSKNTPERNIRGSGLLSEEIIWKCTEEDLLWITNAKEVIVRLYTQDGYIDTKLTEKGKINLNKFYSTFTISKDWLKEPYRKQD